MLSIWFGKKSEAKKLPDSVWRYLRRQFMLDADYLDTLRCFEMEGVFREQPVKLVRIFSPTLAKKYHLSIRTKTDLELHPETLVFEGHIDAEGKIYFADRRASLHRAGNTLPETNKA